MQNPELASPPAFPQNDLAGGTTDAGFHGTLPPQDEVHFNTSNSFTELESGITATIGTNNGDNGYCAAFPIEFQVARPGDKLIEALRYQLDLCPSGTTTCSGGSSVSTSSGSSSATSPVSLVEHHIPTPERINLSTPQEMLNHTLKRWPEDASLKQPTIPLPPLFSDVEQLCLHETLYLHAVYPGCPVDQALRTRINDCRLRILQFRRMMARRQQQIIKLAAERLQQMTKRERFASRFKKIMRGRQGKLESLKNLATRLGDQHESFVQSIEDDLAVDEIALGQGLRDLAARLEHSPCLILC